MYTRLARLNRFPLRFASLVHSETLVFLEPNALVAASAPTGRSSSIGALAVARHAVVPHLVVAILRDFRDEPVSAPDFGSPGDTLRRRSFTDREPVPGQREQFHEDVPPLVKRVLALVLAERSRLLGDGLFIVASTA